MRAAHTHALSRYVKQSYRQPEMAYMYIHSLHYSVVSMCIVYTPMWISTAENTLSIVLSHTIFAPPTHSVYRRRITGRDMGNQTIRKPHFDD